LNSPNATEHHQNATPNIVKYHVNIVKYHHCLTRHRRVELGTHRVTTFLLTFFRKTPPHRAPSRAFAGVFVAGGRWIAAGIAATSPQ
jgi:hypothetical protein